MLRLVLVCSALLQRGVEQLLSLAAVGMYVIYAAGLFLPGDELRDRLGYAVSSEASAKRKYRELIRQTQPLPSGGALLYLDVGAQRVSCDYTVFRAAEVLLGVGSCQQHLVGLLREHFRRHARVGVALVGDGLYPESRRLTKDCSGDVSAGADNDIRLEFLEYLPDGVLCREEVQIRRLRVAPDVLYRDMALESRHFHRREVVARFGHEAGFHALRSSDEHYLRVGKYALELIGDGKRRVDMSGGAAGCEYSLHFSSPINSDLHVLISKEARLSRTGARTAPYRRS